MNYRKFYKEYYQIEFDNSFHIHHIDGNRENNNINNLLLLPKKLHQQYHFLKSKLYTEPFTNKGVSLDDFLQIKGNYGSFQPNNIKNIKRLIFCNRRM